MSGSVTAVIVGCGASKRAYWEWPVDVDRALKTARKSFAYVSDYGLDTSTFQFVDRFEQAVAGAGHSHTTYPKFPAKDLYTSTYANLKTEYASWAGDYQYILSAEHGLIPSGRTIEPYETHLDDVDTEAWVAQVTDQLHNDIWGAGDPLDPDSDGGWLANADRIEVLAGEPYIQPLEETFATLDADVVYPFRDADCAGIGDQMGWLRAEIDAMAPASVNGWTYQPDHVMNGDVWSGDDGRVLVGVFSKTHGNHYVKAYDTRLDGMGGYQEIARATGGADGGMTVKQIRKAAVDWMASTDPAEYEHPAVNAAVFSPPPGYELAAYRVGGRQTEVYYKLQEGAVPPRDRGPDRAVTPETYPYLVVEAWNGSGNASVSLALWQGAHDHEKEPIVEPPDECGLDVALTMAREWAHDHVDAAATADDSSTVGQTTFSQEWA